MIFNNKMEKYLNSINEILELKQMDESIDFKIRKGTNCNGEQYYYLEDNCLNLSDENDLNLTGEALTQLEWECNELYINDSANIKCLAKIALSKLGQIKIILKDLYPSQSFDIVMSIDDEVDDVFPSATIRFYAIRNELYYISHDKLDLERFAQPILIDSLISDWKYLLDINQTLVRKTTYNKLFEFVAVGQTFEAVPQHTFSLLRLKGRLKQEDVMRNTQKIENINDYKVIKWKRN